MSVESRYFPVWSRMPDSRPWGIENRLHWVLDLSFREDESRVRTGLRKTWPGTWPLDRTSKVSIKARRKLAGGTMTAILPLNAVALPFDSRQD